MSVRTMNYGKRTRTSIVNHCDVWMHIATHANADINYGTAVDSSMDTTELKCRWGSDTAMCRMPGYTMLRRTRCRLCTDE